MKTAKILKTYLLEKMQGGTHAITIGGDLLHFYDNSPAIGLMITTPKQSKHFESIDKTPQLAELLHSLLKENAADYLAHAEHAELSQIIDKRHARKAGGMRL